MIQLELADDQEAMLLKSAAQSGLSPNAFVKQLLVRTGILHPDPVSDSLSEQRRKAEESIMAARSASDAPRLQLPEGLTLRQYMHVGHRY